MSLRDWFANREKQPAPVQQHREREIADGLWTKCPNCGVLTYTKDLQNNAMVCAECDHHMMVALCVVERLAAEKPQRHIQERLREEIVLPWFFAILYKETASAVGNIHHPPN